MDAGNISTLIGAICGFGASVTPEVIGLVKAERDHKHDIALKELELQAADKNYTFQLANNALTGSTEELKALLTADAGIQSTPFFNALRASVRPVVTYLLVLMFCIVKLALLSSLFLYHDVKFTEAVVLLWDTDTMSILAAVLSFWFGSRAMEQYRQTIPQPLNITSPPTTRTTRKFRKR